MSRLIWSPTAGSRKLLKPAASLFTLERLVWLIISVGVFLRLVHYLLNRSLWIDEAFVALNIINKSYLELLQPLDYNQAAPFGFLVLEKLAVQLFGESEYSLRFFPFLAGIASLFLFYKVAKWFSHLHAVIIAIGLFALCDRLIYYSAEVKQYSIDVVIALLLYLGVINLQSKKLNPMRIAVFSIIGAVAIWISHPSVFILAGTGMSLLIFAFIKRKWTVILRYLIVFLFWLLSFIGFYFISIRKLSSNEALQKSWDSNHNSFMPFPPLSLSELGWFPDKFFEIFNYPSGLYLTGIAVLAFIMGCTSMYGRSKKKFFLLIFPVLLALLASGLHKYPFKGQLLLFIVPSILLLVAEGAQQVIDKTQFNSKLLGIALVVLLFFHPLYYAARNLKSPDNPPHFVEYQRVREDIKPVLSYVQTNQHYGDVLYLYYASQYAFKYYSSRYNFKYDSGKAVWSKPPEDWFAPAMPSYPPQLIVGEYSRNDWSILENELNEIRGNRRVWVIFSHVSDRRSPLDEEDVFLYLLNRIGTQVDSFKSTEASAYLYDLSKEPKSDISFRNYK